MGFFVFTYHLTLFKELYWNEINYF